MPPTVTRERSVGRQFRRDPAQVSQARRLVREALAEWGFDGYADHLVLISSELVTNALRHGWLRSAYDIRAEAAARWSPARC